MSQVYSQYSKAKIGWIFGLSAWQVGIVAASSVPVFYAINQQAWAAAGLLTVMAAAVTALTIVPVRGRSAAGWLAAAAGFAFGSLRGWSTFRARATHGAVTDSDQVDLPGILAALEIHEGPPSGLGGDRVAIIQHHAMRTWAVTCQVTHPGLGFTDPHERAGMAAGLAGLIDQAERSELIDEILLMVRTVPDDGAERDQWTAAHRTGAPLPGVRAINDQLQQALTGASVRTEVFVTFVVPETRLAKAAKEAGRGIAARARVMYALMAEVETGLKAGVGASDVTWLTSPQLAAACRTGFAPADRISIIDALAAHAAGQNVNADVPWAMAGPSGADTAARHYSHDAWNSISATLTLPIKGATPGALAPILAPAGVGERRCLLIAYRVLPAHRAARATGTSQWGADMGQALRERAGVRSGTKTRDDQAQVAALEAKLARGAAITTAYAVATVTAPKTVRLSECGRALDASIRRAGFAPLRLDLAQDAAFAASVIPLGVSLTRATST
ncbi:MAG: PrgI family protein [Microlunatus sp.]|nr:PrgI family protein [Microlunatus sp.]